MGYEPTTEAGRTAQAELSDIVQGQLKSATGEMNAAVDGAVQSFQKKAGELIAEARDETEKLKERLAAITAAGTTDTAALVTLTEDSIIALNKREEMFKRIGSMTVDTVRKVAHV